MIAHALNEWIKQESERKRQKDAQMELVLIDTEKLTRIWDEWDGMSVMIPNEKVSIFELDVLIELQRRGVDRSV